VLQHLRGDNSGVKLGMVPSGEVLYQFDLLAKAGQITNYSSADQLYMDPVTHAVDPNHLNTTGSYISRLTLFATMYHNSPAGLPVPSNVNLTAADALKLQKMVWDTVTANSTLTLVVASDANKDLKVDTADFNILAGHFGAATHLVSEGDFDGSGTVDSIDFTRLVGEFGSNVTPASLSAVVVPEPAGSFIALLGATWALRRRSSDNKPRVSA
jgi:hypothetical protein